MTLARAAAQDSDLAQLVLDLAIEKSPSNAEPALPLPEGFSQMNR